MQHCFVNTDKVGINSNEVVHNSDLLNDAFIDSQVVGNGSQVDCPVRNAAMDDTIGGSYGVTGQRSDSHS